MTDVLANLELRGVSKRFPGVKALDEISFSVARGEVVGLIGENGAGKSTLLKILNGIYTPDSGQVLVDGLATQFSSPRHAFDSGVAMVFQEQSIIQNLTVAENIFLGREQEFVGFGLISRARMNAAAATLLKRVRLDVHPGRRCGELSFAERQMVEIAKALSLDQRMDGKVTILLDEPTSVLERAEVDLLFSLIAELKQRAGVGFISHRLEEVLAITDRIYVLRDGRVVGEVKTAEATVSGLQEMMVGRLLQHEYYREARQTVPTGAAILSAEGLGKIGAFTDVSFTLRPGEILGIAGVIGSGREDLSRCLAGHMPFDSGRLLIDGEPVRFTAPHDAVSMGIGLVPSERKVEGIVGAFSVAENISLAALSSIAPSGVIDFSRERSGANEWIKRLKIKTPSADTMVAGLSGGNQQKVVLAKWRSAGVRVIILDHPTRGIDVGAKEDVYDLIRDMTAEGFAIVLLGDTLDEVIGLSSYILVMRDGEVVERFDAPMGAKPSQVDLVRRMM